MSQRFPSSGNALGASDPSASFGYLAPVLTTMANTRRWACCTGDENAVVIDQSSPLQLMQQTPIELLNAVRIAAQGSAVKAVQASLMPAAGANLTLNLGTVKSFGVRVRITDSPLNFKFGTLKVELRDGATTLGTAYVIASRLPAEILMLGISNAGGQATATFITNPQIVVYGSAAGFATESESTAVWAETLNMRDLGSVTV